MNKRTQVVSDQLKRPERQIVDGIIKITFDYFFIKEYECDLDRDLIPCKDKNSHQIEMVQYAPMNPHFISKPNPLQRHSKDKRLIWRHKSMFTY